MSTKSPYRPDVRHRRLSFYWLLLPVGLGVVAVAAWVLGNDATRTISYGQFKRKLARHEIATVRVGPEMIDGELIDRDADGQRLRFQTSRVGMEHDEQLYAQLEEALPDGNYEADPGPSVMETYGLPILLVGIMVGGLWLLSKRGGLGSALAFARSRHRLYGAPECRVTFDDVAGIDEAVTELREVAEFLRTPEKYQALGGRIPKGILLVGPPGTGKTLLAKAVAGEAGVPFFSLSGSDFMEMFVGIGAARVRSLFTQAEAKAPCLIFIDELDAIGKARGAGGTGAHDERDQTLNQLLVAMDGFDSNRGILVMAATNRPETLDPALVRPGRFDRNVVVDRPDLVGREQILRVHVKNVPIGAEIDLRRIAAMTSGFVGAELANLVNEAALLAARKGKPHVEHGDFEEGVERVMAGPEKKQRVLRRDEQWRIAYHEAGHALVARSLPGTELVHKVTIVGRGQGALGYTMYRPEDDQYLHTQSWLINKIRTLLGGTVAEEIVYGEFSDGATSDLQRATQIARKMVAEFGMSPRLGRVYYQEDGGNPYLSGRAARDRSWSEQTSREIDQEVRRLLNEALESTRGLLARRRDALDAIAHQLMERETIDATELEALLMRFPVVD